MIAKNQDKILKKATLRAVVVKNSYWLDERKVACTSILNACDFR